MEVLFCNCGKLCKSKTGLKLHQLTCGVALDAICHGKTASKKSEVVSNIYCKDVQEFWDLSEVIAKDADDALKGNKSAGRRSRAGLIKLRDMVPVLRKLILDKNK